jgi:intracellular septation protein A
MTNLLLALRPLAWDFLPTIAFALLTALHVDVRISTAVAVGVGLAQVLIVKALKRQVGVLQWAGLGLAVVFGAVSIATNDARFVMIKPTIIYLAIAAVMLTPGWMARYLPPLVQQHAPELLLGWGYVWAGLMVLTAALNALVALRFTGHWPLFIAVFPLWSKLALFGVQYVHLRHVVGARVTAALLAQARAEAPAQAAPQAA